MWQQSNKNNIKKITQVILLLVRQNTVIGYVKYYNDSIAKKNKKREKQIDLFITTNVKSHKNTVLAYIHFI